MDLTLVKDSGVNLSLLDELMPEPKQTEQKETGEKFIMYSRPVDTFTVKRSRVKLTPGVCEKCGLDLVKLAFDQNKVSSLVYEELSSEVQLVMQELVKRHKIIQHSASDELIITEKPKQWLTGSR